MEKEAQESLGYWVIVASHVSLVLSGPAVPGHACGPHYNLQVSGETVYAGLGLSGRTTVVERSGGPIVSYMVK